MSSVFVRAKVLVEIPVGKWGTDSPIKDLNEIAKREGYETVEKAIKAVGGKVIGIPSILYVVAEQETN